MSEKLTRNSITEKRNRPRKSRKTGKKKEKAVPTYRWIDKVTEKTVDVERKISEYEMTPDKPEALEAGFDIEEFAEADWERVISEAPAFTGDKGKGYW
jgi:hypothetical protein